MLLLNDLFYALSGEATLWGAGQCKGRHQFELKFQHLLSKSEHIGKASVGRRQPCGEKEKGDVRQSLPLFRSCFQLTLKALQEDLEQSHGDRPLLTAGRGQWH